MATELYRDLLYGGSQRLADSQAGDTPYLDAVILLSFISGMTREKLMASLIDPCPADTAESFYSALSERESGIPIAYITGVKEFYGRDFHVEPGILIPRPDTETAVEAALAICDAGLPEAPVLDLCSGSGCIGITIQAERPGREVVLADISDQALEVSARNAETLLGYQLKQYHSDLFSDIPGTFSMIITNPPYLTAGEMRESNLVEQGEPEIALAAGKDGLDIIRRVVAMGFDKVMKKGYLIIECGHRQGRDVCRLLRERGFSECSIRHDLGNRERVVIGRRV